VIVVAFRTGPRTLSARHLSAGAGQSRAGRFRGDPQARIPACPQARQLADLVVFAQVRPDTLVVADRITPRRLPLSAEST